jgi:hypothetical protein
VVGFFVAVGDGVGLGDGVGPCATVNVTGNIESS